MTHQPITKSAGPFWSTTLALAIAGALSFTPPGRTLRHQVFATLRLAKPQPVNVNIPSFSGPNANRQLQDMVSGMISKTVNVTLDEQDQPVANADAASKLAGFTVRLPRARKDAPTLIVTGAHTIEMAVDRGQLRTIFTEAGRPNVVLPASLDGAAVAVRTPRAIRAQYGNCPVPVANSLQEPDPGSATTVHGQRQLHRAHAESGRLRGCCRRHGCRTAR